MCHIHTCNHGVIRASAESKERKKVRKKKKQTNKECTRKGVGIAQGLVQDF